MKIVLDTNVLVSALLSPTGAPAQVVGLALTGRVAVLCDGRILLEYRDVLYRPRFGFGTAVVEPILEFLEAEAQQIVAEPSAAEFRDAEDRAFYEVAASEEGSYLVTGNKKHYPRDARVVTPREFLERYRHRRPDRS